MTTKGKSVSKTIDKGADKPKAAKVSVNTLVITAAYAKTFSSGKNGFFGKAIDPTTGKKYQIVGAVELAG